MVLAPVQIRRGQPHLLRAAIDVAAVGAHDHVPGLLAPGLDAVPAYAARPTLDLVQRQVLEEHRVAVLAKVLVVLCVGAPREPAFCAAEGGDFFRLLVILAFALQEKVPSGR